MRDVMINTENANDWKLILRNYASKTKYVEKLVGRIRSTFFCVAGIADGKFNKTGHGRPRGLPLEFQLQSNDDWQKVWTVLTF